MVLYLVKVNERGTAAPFRFRLRLLTSYGSGLGSGSVSRPYKAQFSAKISFRFRYGKKLRFLWFRFHNTGPKYHVLAQQAFELSYREEQMEFYRDCPIDPDTSSYYCLGGWEEEIRQAALSLTPSS